MVDFASWGQFPRVEQTVSPIGWRHEPLPLGDDGLSVLPYGMGRSYGDSCLNADGKILPTRNLSRFIQFDEQSGVLRCEAGATLSEILAVTMPRGWFLPVLPGTKFVTLGGSIANDIHGKNHHVAGAFGNHVLALELLRSDGTRILCSEETNPDFLTATIGGLGLTGLITWAELQLIPVSSGFIEQDIQVFDGLADFFALSDASSGAFDYTVAWLDCGGGRAGGARGVFIRGNHAPGVNPEDRRVSLSEPRVSLPWNAPGFVLNKGSISLLNEVYFRLNQSRQGARRVPCGTFFFPLDGVGHWNRMYGKRGFLQYQCVIPRADGESVLTALFGRIREAGAGSFLTVLKVFGDRESRGVLSFPRPGVTLALDLANRGEQTFKLCSALDDVVAEAGGALYPAKDARMSGAMFRQSFPEWEAFVPHIDPRFSSSFWRRVHDKGPRLP